MRINKGKKVLIIAPHFEKQGGVSNYYDSMSKFLPKNFFFLYRGLKTEISNNAFYVFVNYILSVISTHFKLVYYLIRKGINEVVLNTSFDKISVYRDALLSVVVRLFNRKYLVFHHGWNFKFSQNLSFVDRFFVRKLYKANKIIVLGEEFKNAVIKLGFDSNKVIVETTIVDEELVRDYDNNKRKFDKNSIKLLFLSRILQEKGIFEVLDAFKIISQNYEFAGLDICGDGPDIEVVRQRIIDERLTNVSVRGFVRGENKMMAFCEADVFVFPSYYGEGLPISLLEAMAFGLPIITTNVGGIKDFFENEKMGFLIPPKNVIEIVNKVDILINNPELRKNMSVYNYTYAKERFWSSKVAERFINICLSEE